MFPQVCWHVAMTLCNCGCDKTCACSHSLPHTSLALTFTVITFTVITFTVTGALGVPVHWSMKSGSRAVCLRFGPQTAGSGVDAPWSHPIEASFPGGVDRHVAITVRPPQPSETAKPGYTLPGPSLCKSPRFWADFLSLFLRHASCTICSQRRYCVRCCVLHL